MSPESSARQPGREHYGAALLLILTACVFIMAAPDGDWARVVIVGLEGLALIFCSRAAGTRPGFQRFCVGLAAVALVLAGASVIAGINQHAVFISSASTVLVVLATPAIAIGIVRKTRAGEPVTVQTMMSVLCIYLLMTLAFASAFGIIAAGGDSSFFTQGEQFDQLRNYLYFSITTITTLGLGDFAPAGDLGRSLTAAESLIGQIYLVTVVAVIVGNLGRSRKSA